MGDHQVVDQAPLAAHLLVPVALMVGQPLAQEAHMVAHPAVDLAPLGDHQLV